LADSDDRKLGDSPNPKPKAACSQDANKSNWVPPKKIQWFITVFPAKLLLEITLMIESVDPP